MDNVSLRKLTGKSKITGLSVKYPNKTVLEVMDEHPSTIWSIYCRYEKITFTDDILEMLSQRFKSFKIIPKPGIDKTQMDRSNDQRNLVLYSEMDYLKLLSLIRYKKLMNHNIPQDLMLHFNKKKAERLRAKNKPEVYTKSSLLAMNRFVK